MRALILACVGGMALATSAQASPFVSKPAAIELGTTAPVELAAQDCGWGWHRTRWRDHWGYWHWGDCVPDGGSYGGWGTGSYYPYPGWRVAPSRSGWGNP